MDVDSVMEWLRDHGTPATLKGMSRYGLPSENALGVAVKDIQSLGKLIGRDHDLALALWNNGCYEARMLTSFIGDPERLTATQMDRWCNDFDNWGICDTLCFHLFDRSPHAWTKVSQWSEKHGEFQKRAAYALLACLAGHDKDATDRQFLEALKLVEGAATDGRNFVKKALVWALRRIAGRNPVLYAATVTLSKRLTDSADTSARWTGKTALREILKSKPRPSKPHPSKPRPSEPRPERSAGPRRKRTP